MKDGPGLATIREQDRLRVSDELADWTWTCRYCGGEFDFSDEADFRRGVDCLCRWPGKRYTLSRPARHRLPGVIRLAIGCTTTEGEVRRRGDCGEEEVRAAGWDRSDYAPAL